MVNILPQLLKCEDLVLLHSPVMIANSQSVYWALIMCGNTFAPISLCGSPE